MEIDESILFRMNPLDPKAQNSVRGLLFASAPKRNPLEVVNFLRKPPLFHFLFVLSKPLAKYLLLTYQLTILPLIDLIVNINILRRLTNNLVSWAFNCLVMRVGYIFCGNSNVDRMWTIPNKNKLMPEPIVLYHTHRLICLTKKET